MLRRDPPQLVTQLTGVDPLAGHRGQVLHCTPLEHTRGDGGCRVGGSGAVSAVRQQARLLRLQRRTRSRLFMGTCAAGAVQASSTNTAQWV
jgi:hypothetical protein